MDLIKNKSWKKWDWLAVFYLFIFSVIIFISPVFGQALFEDSSYHLITAQNFAENNSILTWKNWESVPEGRAHTYPPLYHVVYAIGLEIFNPSPLTAATTAPRIAIVLSLLIFWIGLRLISGPIVSFLAISILGSYPPYIIFLGTIAPASLSLAAIPLLAYLIWSKRFWGVTALLIILFYSHQVIPWIILGTILIWAFINHQKSWPVLRSFIVALLAFSPWLIYELSQLDFLKYIDRTYLDLPKKIADLNVHLIIWVLGLIGIYLFLKNSRHRKNPAINLFLILFFVQLPILLTSYPGRFTVSGGHLALVTILSIFLANFWGKSIKFNVGIILFLVFLNFGYYEILTEPTTNKIINQWSPGLITFTYLGKTDKNFSFNYLPAYNEETFALVETIKNNATKNQPLFFISDTFNFSYYLPHTTYIPAQILASLAERSMINSRMPEVFYRQFPPLRRAPLVIAHENQTLDFRGEQTEKQQQVAQVLEEKFDQVGSVERFRVFKNKNRDNLISKGKARAIFPLKLTFSIFIMLILIILGEPKIKSARDKKQSKKKDRSTQDITPNDIGEKVNAEIKTAKTNEHN